MHPSVPVITFIQYLQDQQHHLAQWSKEKHSFSYEMKDVKEPRLQGYLADDGKRNLLWFGFTAEYIHIYFYDHGVIKLSMHWTIQENRALWSTVKFKEHYLSNFNIEMIGQFIVEKKMVHKEILTSSPLDWLKHICSDLAVECGWQYSFAG